MRYFILSILSLFAFTTLISEYTYAARKKISGEAVVDIAEDFKNNKSEMIYSVRDKASGRLQRLQFKTSEFPIWFQTGKKIQVEFEETLKDTDAAFVYSISQDTIQTDNVAAAYSTDRRSTLILRVTSSDGTPYLSQDTVINYMYAESGSVAKYFLDTTRGKISFNGDVNSDGQIEIHDVTISATVGDNCSYGNWASLADQEAVSKNSVSLSQFRHVIYVLPSNAACGWWGLANLSSASSTGTSRAWVRQGSQNVYAHELGHNLGLHHASTDPENDGTINSEYGDGSCVMGNSGMPHLNAGHMDQLGVFSAWSRQVVSATAGSYQLTSLSADPETALNPQILKIRKGTTSEYYYFSFRTLNSYDSRLSSTFTRGVSVHRYLGGRTYFIKSLAPSESFVDSQNGIQVTAQSISADGQSIGLVVDVVCSSQQPTLSINSQNIYSDINGNAVVNWFIRNNDGSYCPSTRFNLSDQNSVAASSVFSSSEITLAPGASASGTLTMNSSLSYSFQIILSDVDGQNPSHIDVSVSGQVSVDTIAPSSVTQLSYSISRSSQVQLNWSGASDAQSGIGSYLIMRDGVQIGTSSSTSYTDSSVTAGTYLYSVIAVDRVGNRSASSPSISVVVSAKKGGGGKPRR